MSTVKKSLSELKPLSEKRRAALKARQDKDIDFSDIPEAGPEFWKSANVVLPEGPKHPVTIRLDQDILAYFKDMGRGYQTRINAVLRAYMEAQKHQPEIRK
ncbi:MAG: BrnA antitoxin family protein [Pseudomonadota bacterium]